MSRILFISDFPSEDDVRAGLPLGGYAGALFNRHLTRGGVSRADCVVYNFLPEAVPGAEIENVCVSKPALPPGYLYPPILKAKYLHPRFLPCFPALAAKIKEVNPNILVALGPVAQWALTGKNSIKKYRGFIGPSTLVAGKKVLSTYHPRDLLKSPADTITFQLDLGKALRQSEFPEIRLPQRTVAIDVDLNDIIKYQQVAAAAEFMSVDIETDSEMITCIGFACSEDYGFVVAFRDWRKPDGNYWSSQFEELHAWRLVNELLNTPCVKVFQNGVYDLQYLYKMGLTVKNATADTMLLHHANYQEMEKGLGYMASIYTDQNAWKEMHQHGRNQVVKKEE
jgi:uracil-DNA glycosylase